MKIVLCALNSKYIHSTLAVWYLHSAVKEICDSVVVEGTINERVEDVEKRILEMNPNIVGFSTYIWNKTIVVELAKRIKEKTGATILLGGPEVSYNAEEILTEYSFVDYVISGEGEEPLAKICSGLPVEEIEGICYKKDGGVVIKEPYISKKDPPNPYTSEYMKGLNGRIAYLETSRGCPYRCAFCLSGRMGGVRFFNLDEARKNIVLLANSGTQTVKFIDRTFNADRKRAREIFSFIMGEYGKNIPKNVCFHFEIEGELLDNETLELLKKAPIGLFQFEIGLQSFNQNTLEAIRRKTNLSLLVENIEKVISLGNIHTHIDLIIGLPNESFDSFKSSFDLAYKLKPHMLQLGFLKLLHGTALRENANVHNSSFINTPPYEIVSNKWLKEQETASLHMLEDVFERMYNSRRFALTCEYLEGCYERPFDMYFSFSRFVLNHPFKSLDEFTRLMYEFYGSNPNVNRDRLRDTLAIDRLATNRMGSLPDFLKLHSPYLKKTLNFLDTMEETKRPAGIKRSATPLLTENMIAYVDYDSRDYLTNRFLVKFTKIYNK